MRKESAMSLPRYVIEIRESRVWVNSKTGERASVYGAKPYGSDWEVITDGVTVVWDNGTVGAPALRPGMARDDVVAYANMVNARERDHLASHALAYPETAASCAVMAREIPEPFV